MFGITVIMKVLMGLLIICDSTSFSDELYIHNISRWAMELVRRNSVGIWDCFVIAKAAISTGHILVLISTFM